MPARPDQLHRRGHHESVQSIDETIKPIARIPNLTPNCTSPHQIRRAAQRKIRFDQAARRGSLSAIPRSRYPKPMPLPVRYAQQVPEIARVWEPAGYFDAQLSIWLAQCEVMHDLDGDPSAEDLAQIRAALCLSPDEVAELSVPHGHETNRLIRTVQAKLPARLGNFIHRGNTSSDVLDTSLALQIIRSLDLLHSDFEKVADELQSLALRHALTPQIARTHGQHATPHTFGRQVLGWYAESLRCLDRIARARAVIAFGKLSGEVGTSVFIRPELEEKALAHLGLAVDPAPTQVISRDRHAEVVSLMAVNAGTLSRIAVDLSLLAITDLGEVREPFDPAAQQGSSSMPHKRNTELCERVRGLARRVRSAALEELESMDLWLERDISHSSTERFTFPDCFGALAYSARLVHTILAGLVVYEERMQANIEQTHGAIYANRLLNALLDVGALSRPHPPTAGVPPPVPPETDRLSRTDAYELVKSLSQQALDTGVHLRDLAARDQRITALLSAETLNGLFDPDFYLRNIATAYRRLGLTPPGG
jgi:adenylosuccinate lyase